VNIQDSTIQHLEQSIEESQRIVRTVSGQSIQFIGLLERMSTACQEFEEWGTQARSKIEGSLQSISGEVERSTSEALRATNDEIARCLAEVSNQRENLSSLKISQEHLLEFANDTKTHIVDALKIFQALKENIQKAQTISDVVNTKYDEAERRISVIEAEVRNLKTAWWRRIGMRKD
jgi:chromosome segregation ATPase